jgi:hypothetical protein
MPFIKKMLPTIQISYAIILQLMHIPNDPGLLLLTRLQNIFIERPSLMLILKQYRPEDINLPTLLEVLDTLKAPGVADIDIKKYLKSPATEWKDEILRNQSSNIDPTAATNRAKFD